MQCNAVSFHFTIQYLLLDLCLQGMSSSPRPLLQQATSFRRQSSMQRTSSAAESQSSTAEQSLAARGLPAMYDPNGENPAAVMSTLKELTRDELLSLGWERHIAASAKHYKGQESSGHVLQSCV